MQVVCLEKQRLHVTEDYPPESVERVADSSGELTGALG